MQVQDLECKIHFSLGRPLLMVSKRRLQTPLHTGANLRSHPFCALDNEWRQRCFCCFGGVDGIFVSKPALLIDQVQPSCVFVSCFACCVSCGVDECVVDDVGCLQGGINFELFIVVIDVLKMAGVIE